jgi:hypothetical protein
MKVFRIIIAISLISILPKVAWSLDTIDVGKDLLRECSSNEKLSTFHCYAYVRGLVDGINAAQGFQKQYNEINKASSIFAARFCIPNDVVFTQIVDVIVLHIKNNPKNQLAPAGVVSVVALKDAWPCAK